MRCLLELFGLALTSTLAGTALADSLSTARFMSFAVRDQPPSVDEAKAVQSGAKTVAALTSDWVSSPEHIQRVHRHFRDMFGVADNVTILNRKYVLADQGGGVLALTGIPAKATCDPSTAVQVSAWWLDAGQTVAMCPSAVSTAIKPVVGSATLNCANAGNSGIVAAGCGCGPNQILCIPLTLTGSLMTQLREEFAERGAYVYQQNLGWDDLLGGDFFYGARPLYWYYLLTQTVLPKATLPAQSELDQLQALSMTASTQVAFPSGPARAGVVTAPGFLINNDSYRSRVRIMTQSLLCKDVDASLNVDKLASYLNPSFSAADKAHGAQANCSGCHYPMDNMGSLNFGWDAQGLYQPSAPSQIGHAFGEDGTGPAFLATSYVQRASGFAACMAQKAWEGFSGLPWATLSSADQQTFTQAATTPKLLLTSVLNSAALQNSRATAPVATAAPASSTLSFAGDIEPILAASCAGASCHSTGSPFVSFVSDQGTFQSLATNVAARLKSTGPDKMPPANATGTALSAADAAKLLQFLGQ